MANILTCDFIWADDACLLVAPLARRRAVGLAVHVGPEERVGHRINAERSKWHAQIVALQATDL